MHDLTSTHGICMSICLHYSVAKVSILQAGREINTCHKLILATG